VTATVVNTNTQKRPGGRVETTTAEGKYYRDSLGRTRTERGNRVVIHDPAMRTVIVLDTSARVARVMIAGQDAQAPAAAPVSGDAQASATLAAASATRPRPILEPMTDLGTRVIEGVLAKGSRMTAGFPVGSLRNIVPFKRTIEIWRSETLRIPVMSKTTDSLRGERVEIYKDIATNVSLDPALFQVPPGFQVIKSGAAAAGAAP
jgi:hypothetical protein